MFGDFLAKHPVEVVAAWYRRLGAWQIARAPELKPPLAGEFLLKWLDNRDPKAVCRWDAPEHLRSSKVVGEVLRYHRNVFLTVEKGRVPKGEKWLGIVPRLQGLAGYTTWDLSTELPLKYESLCDIAPTLWAINRIQNSGTSGERDLLGSLRGFQMKSEAIFTGKRQAGQVAITCKTWHASGRDRYDWNYREFFTVPNPDYKSTVKGALEPEQERVTVYHSNAKRLEDAKLAAPYDVEIRPWQVTDSNVVGPATIDPTRKL
jgi:hypothetical protein